MDRTRFRYLFLALLAAAFFPSAGEGAAKEAGAVGAAAPRFTVANLRGEETSLDGLLSRRKTVVLNFWGTRCGACIQEIPSLNGIRETFRENVEILGVNVDGLDSASLSKQMSALGIPIRYEVIPDPQMKMIDLFEMEGAPLTIVIDPDGIVRYRHVDYKAGDEEELIRVLRGITGKR